MSETFPKQLACSNHGIVRAAKEMSGAHGPFLASDDTCSKLLAVLVLPREWHRRFPSFLSSSGAACFEGVVEVAQSCSCRLC